MANFLRGSQLGDKYRQVSREERRQQIAQRNKELRRNKTKSAAKKILYLATAALIGWILFDRQFIRYDAATIPQSYRDSVAEYFNANPLRKSKLFFDAHDLSEKITSQHPDVGEVKVSLSLFTRDKIELTPRQPAFVWQTASKTLLGDDEGNVYAEIPNLIGYADLPLLKDQAKLDIQAGDKAVPTTTLKYIHDLETEFSPTAIEVDYYQIPVAAREVHIFLKNQKHYIKFSLDRSIVGQVNELQKVTSYIAKNNLIVKNYIDLRTEDKAFYR